MTAKRTYTHRILFAFTAALALPVFAFATEPKLTPEERALKKAISKLDAQLPLASADHTALKKAALARKLDKIRVCGDPGNMPLSDVNRQGYGNKIIELVAEEMDTRVSYFWRPYLERGITRQTFESNDCDVLLDMPVGFDSILTTTPLYKTTYVLAYRNDSKFEIDSLDDPDLKKLKIGVFQTSGLRTALTKRGIIENVSLHVLSHNADLNPENQPWRQVKQVVDGELDIAGVWGPFAGWRKAQGDPLTVKPVNLWEDEIPLEFEIAIGLRHIDWILKYKFDLALEAKKKDIEKILRDYGVPMVECSKCVVQGDIPAHGIYSIPLSAAAEGLERTGPIAADQKVTRERVKNWLSDGADINTELANAVLAADIERIKFLIGEGADPNAQDKQGYAPLQSAARQRKPAVIKALISLQADVNGKDRDGYTALHHAVLRDHPESITALMESGADAAIETPAGYPALAVAVLEDHYRAAMALIEAGAPVDAKIGKTAMTPLMLAAGKEENKLHLGAGHQRVQRWNPKDPKPLDIARALLQKGADVNAASETGATALILAAAHNNTPIVGLLAQAGADVNAKTRAGKTAADIAKQNGNEAVVSLLRLLQQATGQGN